MLANVGRYARFFADGLRPQRRARDREPLAEHDAQVEFCLRPLEKRDDGVSPFERHAVEIFLHVRAGDHVEQYVDAAAPGKIMHDLLPVFVPVINRFVGAELFAKSALVSVAGRGYDGTAVGLGELDRGRADAARAAVHEKGLAAGEPAACKNVVPDREKSLRYRGGLDQRQPGGHGQAMVFMHAAILGVTAAMGQRHDRIADFPAAHGRAGGHDFAGNFEARQVARVVGHRVQPEPLQHVRPIHARGGHLDEHVVFPDSGHALGDGDEHFGTTGFFDRDGAHRCRYVHGTGFLAGIISEYDAGLNIDTRNALWIL